MMRLRCSAVVAIAAFSGTALADSLHVPGDFPTIQAGIDAAINGDEVVVADGIYTGEGNRDLDFGGKLITVRSENGPNNCIIDCQGSEADPHRGFYFQSGETNAAVVEGFSITNGLVTGSYPDYNGGAILCLDSSPTITGCTFSDNSAIWLGGGIYIGFNSTLIVSNCTFSGNWAGGGGAVACIDSSPTVTNCTFSGNWAGGGGAISIGSSFPIITNNTIVNNSAVNAGGGGIHVRDYAIPIIRGNLIADNTSIYAGGGMYLGATTSPLIESNVLIYNHSGGWGGGGINSWTSYIFYGTFATIRNNLIAYNTATHGGGLYCRYDRAVITNNLIVYNFATLGGGIYALNYTAQAPQVTNCILWQNTAGLGPQVYLVKTPGSAISIRYSNVEGGWPGEGNIDADPLFVDPGGEDDVVGTEDDNLRLLPGSPCIDAADNTAVPKGIDTDLDGNPRFVDDPDTKDTGTGDPPIVDMGAYEFQPWDLDGDGCVGILDLLALLAAWGTNPGHPADFDNDGTVGILDLLALLANWGPCP